MMGVGNGMSGRNIRRFNKNQHASGFVIGQRMTLGTSYLAETRTPGKEWLRSNSDIAFPCLKKHVSWFHQRHVRYGLYPEKRGIYSRLQWDKNVSC